MPDSPHLDVAVAADMCVDLVLRGNVRPRFSQVEQLIDDYCLEVGGSANIFAAQISKLGARAGVIGVVGADPFGTFLLDRLRETGIDVSCVRRDASVRTGIGVALAEPNDRAILTYPGTIGCVDPDDLPRYPAKICRHWHIASFFLLTRLRPIWPEFVARCRTAGVTTSLDSNWDPEGRWEDVVSLLPLIDVFLPNGREAAALSGERAPIDAAQHLSRLGPLVVVKCGQAGAVAVHRDQSWTLDPAVMDGPATPIVDSVGAGDNFDAGFLHAWLRGRPIPECLALAHRCAVASLAAAGGLMGQLVNTGGS